MDQSKAHPSNQRHQWVRSPQACPTLSRIFTNLTRMAPRKPASPKPAPKRTPKSTVAKKSPTANVTTKKTTKKAVRKVGKPALASGGAATKQKVAGRVTRSATHPLVLGIDFGGSGIKGAPVDLVDGKLATDRKRIDTPQPSTPQACAEVIADIVRSFENMTAADGPIGITYPGVVFDGVTHTAANVDKGWIGLDADAMLEEALKRRVTVLNDAQAAVLAEINFGAGRGAEGMVLMLTFGTGIGSGLAYRGVALPGVELGHLRMHGQDAEKIAAASIKDEKKLSWKAWTDRVNDYLARIETMLYPELIIIGGGVSDEPEKFLARLKTRAPIVPAKLANGAGIVGAAIAASRRI
jgi:polyphosphate glucokinase